MSVYVIALAISVTAFEICFQECMALRARGCGPQHVDCIMHWIIEANCAAVNANRMGMWSSMPGNGWPSASANGCHVDAFIAGGVACRCVTT